MLNSFNFFRRDGFLKACKLTEERKQRFYFPTLICWNFNWITLPAVCHPQSRNSHISALHWQHNLKRASSHLCHTCLQMLWPMLMWVSESKGDQLWSVGAITGFQNPPEASLSAPRRVIPTGLDVSNKAAGERDEIHWLFGFPLLIMPFKISCFISRVFHHFYRT